MARTDFKSVNGYARSLPEGTRPAFGEARGAIRKAVPSAGEKISYQIAAFTLDGRPFLYLSGWKAHISLHPLSDALLAAVPEVEAHAAGKGTMRFALGGRLPLGLIRRIAKAAAAEHRVRQRGTGSK
jgi:uncharacterized protein YdhG (YjbR/CyaY superfamily)